MDSQLKRAAGINGVLPLLRWVPPTDDNNLDDKNEQRTALSMFIVEDLPEESWVSLGGIMIAGAASLTGLLLVPQVNAVKPVAAPQSTTTSWNELVRQAEGASEYARRNRYVEYKFGAAGGRSRQFWGGNQ